MSYPFLNELLIPFYQRTSLLQASRLQIKSNQIKCSFNTTIIVKPQVYNARFKGLVATGDQIRWQHTSMMLGRWLNLVLCWLTWISLRTFLLRTWFGGNVHWRNKPASCKRGLVCPVVSSCPTACDVVPCRRTYWSLRLMTMIYGLVRSR